MLAFDADKNLYISIGDGGNADDATGEVLKIVAAPAAVWLLGSTFAVVSARRRRAS